MSYKKISALIENHDSSTGNPLGEYISSIVKLKNYCLYKTLTGVLDPRSYPDQVPKFVLKYIEVNWNYKR